ncbi:MAG: NAD(P)/FAD-dependent oxidoreductase [Aquificae bacterium]|nr:NAD(P)/FAD-dependent oxidoreductase [Aquificota bacterium]
MEFDLVVLGCGSAGTEAVKEALRYTKRILCVDRSPEAVGGTCLNRGCVPAKFLRKGALLSEEVKRASFYGLSASLGETSFAGAVDSVRRSVITPIREGLLKFFKAKGVKLLFSPQVRVLGPNLLEVGGKRVSFRFLLVATGSSPSALPGLVSDGRFVLDTDSLWDLTELPRRLLIVGGGVSGVEFAYSLKLYGAEEVYLVELEKGLLPTAGFPPDAVRRLERALKGLGVKVFTGRSVAEVDAARRRVLLSDGTVLEVDAVLLTVGRRPNTSDLGLEEVGVELDPKGFVKTKKGYRTSVETIFAAGDVLPTPALAHAAEGEARLAVRNAFENRFEELDYDRLPSVVYSYYELGRFGKTETDLRREKVPFEVKLLNFRSVARALAEGEEGLVKVYASPEGRILGAVVLSRKSTDSLLHLLLEAENLGRLKGLVFAHPTVEEVLKNL